MTKIISKLQIDSFIKKLNECFCEMNKGNFESIEDMLKELEFLSIDEYIVNNHESIKKKDYDVFKNFNDLELDDDLDNNWNDDWDNDLELDGYLEFNNDCDYDFEKEIENDELMEILTERIDELINSYFDMMGIDEYIDVNELKDSIYLSEDPKDKLEYLADDLVEFTKNYYSLNEFCLEDSDCFKYKNILNRYIVRVIGSILYENIERFYKEYFYDIFEKKFFCNNISKKNCIYYIKFLSNIYYIINHEENWIKKGLEDFNNFVDPYRAKRVQLKIKKGEEKKRKIQEVKDLKQKGIKVVDISKKMGISRKTVYNYLNDNSMIT